MRLKIALCENGGEVCGRGWSEQRAERVASFASLSPTPDTLGGMMALLGRELFCVLT